MTKINLKLGSKTFSFGCQRIEEGVAINPKLPQDFDRTDNSHRPARHLAWWNVPYILENGPQSYELRCLNGGAWDRSTWCGSFPTLAEALSQVPAATISYGEAARARSHQLHAELEKQTILRAAAPELLEALKGVLRVADRQTVEFDAARAAIAKAEPL